MLNEIINAVARKLSDSFREATIYTKEVEQGIKLPCFFVALVGASRLMIRGSMYADKVSLAVHYMTEDESESEEILAVLESLYQVLEVVEICDGPIRGVEMSSELTDSVGHFFITYPLHIIYAAKKEESMKSVESSVSTIKE